MLIHLRGQARIRDENAATRATVVSAIRYTFADTAQSYDELLAPLLMDFLSLMIDQDLVCFTIYSSVCRFHDLPSCRLSGGSRYLPSTLLPVPNPT
jgi:hypothetical protein